MLKRERQRTEVAQQRLAEANQRLADTRQEIDAERKFYDARIHELIKENRAERLAMLATITELATEIAELCRQNRRQSSDANPLSPPPQP